MNPQIINFLMKKRVGALAVILPDKSSHSAAVHYSECVDPLKLYIQTSR